MQVTKVSIHYEVKHSDGNYGNFGSGISLEAALEPGEDQQQVLIDLTNQARQHVQELLDDELEENGDMVKYTHEPLFMVIENKARACTVLIPAALAEKLPNDKNWKIADQWSYRGTPTKMRLPKAQGVFDALRSGKSVADSVFSDGWGEVSRIYQFIVIEDEAFTQLPPLPDAGPEPFWHAKNLKWSLQNLSIPENRWEEIATLEWVTDEYLQRLRNHRHDYFDDPTPEKVIAFIKANPTFPPLEPVPELIEEEEGRFYEDEDDDKPY